MSLFDLQDVCIAIGSIATLDLPMVVDLIGIYGLKGPYSNPKPSSGRLLPSSLKAAAAAAARLLRKIVSGKFYEENPFVLISSVLLVQADEGVSFLVVDRIGDIYRNLPRRAGVIVTTVGARHNCQQDLESIGNQNLSNLGHATAACGGATWTRDGARGRTTVADEGCATMRERACMAAPDRRSSCAPVPHERRMVCCPFA
ncbi:cation/H(+) antiporter 20-like [Dorcoceras hygrometricum]|uniref:Cation/H(+) antiporter 20-like n=1 Tax=Dorcoceras hygrometricum TaxID=472368 RepID=A0A2Z7B1M4_9LAMI|nr:cation/H(+) antiporter 20-like [Dorcoceras hygrometricum]